MPSHSRLAHCRLTDDIHHTPPNRSDVWSLTPSMTEHQTPTSECYQRAWETASVFVFIRHPGEEKVSERLFFRPPMINRFRKADQSDTLGFFFLLVLLQVSTKHGYQTGFAKLNSTVLSPWAIQTSLEQTGFHKEIQRIKGVTQPSFEVCFWKPRDSLHSSDPQEELCTQARSPGTQMRNSLDSKSKTSQWMTVCDT